MGVGEGVFSFGGHGLFTTGDGVLIGGFLYGAGGFLYTGTGGRGSL